MDRFSVPGPTAVPRIIEDHRSDNWSQQIVDDLRAVLTQVNGIKPELLVQVFFNGEHSLNAPGLGRLDQRGPRPSGSNSGDPRSRLKIDCGVAVVDFARRRNIDGTCLGAAEPSLEFGLSHARSGQAC